MTEHKLKTWPDPFEAVWNLEKRYELRVNDRGFDVGHLLLLQEWDPQKMKYSGRWVRALVTYMTRPGSFPGLEAGHCIMSIQVQDKGQVMCIKAP